MRGIFDHRNATRIAQRHDRIHVAGMSAHMADQHRLRIVQLGGQIGDIDPVVAAHLDQHGNAIGMDHCRGDGGEGEGGDQDLRALRQIQRLDRNEQGGRTGRHGQRIAAAHQVCEFGFQKGDRRIFLRGVAEQIARAQQPVNLDPRGFRDGFCIVDIRGQGLSVRSHEMRLS